MVAKLEAELERERVERNWSESERDRVSSFWEITKHDLEDKKAELRNLENTVEGAEERHQLEIKVRLSSLRPKLHYTDTGYEHQQLRSRFVDAFSSLCNSWCVSVSLKKTRVHC